MFELEDFNKAKRHSPELEKWVNQPENFIKELGSDKIKSIKMSEFTDYHAWVTSVFKEIFEGMSALNPEAGLDLETKFQSIYNKQPEDLTKIPE